MLHWPPVLSVLPLPRPLPLPDHMGFCSACTRWATPTSPLSVSILSLINKLNFILTLHRSRGWSQPMPGSSWPLLQFLTGLVSDEHPAPSLTLTATGNSHYSQPLTPHSCHAILFFVVQSLLSFLDLMYKDGTSPFATHLNTMGFAVFCLLAYCWVYGAGLSICSMTLLGSLLVASLASIFVPDRLQWVVYMLYTLMWTGKFLCRLPGHVEALVRPTWERCRWAFPFPAPSLRRRCHTSRGRGSILTL